MEQAKYWMWMKRKHSLCHVQASTTTNNDSWEEQAFAEDAAGPLGGCIWPPRSYCCNFCRREFKSAQALGGHMNVHRRDRAQLKQTSSTSQNEILHTHHHHHQNPCIQLGFHQYPPHEASNLILNPNPNSNPLKVIASPISPSRDSASSTQENCSEQTLVSPYSSSILNQEEFIKPTDLLVGFDLVVHQKGPTGSNTKEKETIGCKRRRTDDSSLCPFLNSSSVVKHHLPSEVVGVNPSSMEDLDLELRLGDRPKVK